MRMRKAVIGTLALLLAVGTISFNGVVYAEEPEATAENVPAEAEIEQTETVENNAELSGNAEENTDVASDSEKKETVESNPQENETKAVTAAGEISGDGWTLDESGVFTLLKDITYTGQTYDWKQYTDQIKEVRIAEGVTEIPNVAFISCPNLQKVTLSSTVKRIGTSAFSGNANLTEVILNDGLEYVGHSAFASAGITSIRLPDGVTWGGDAFTYCKNLTGTLVIPANSKWEQGSNAQFYGIGATAVVIEEGVTEITNQFLSGCENLQYIRIPKSLVTIGQTDFENGSWDSPIPGCCIIGYKGTMAEKYVEHWLGIGSEWTKGMAFHAIDGDEHTGEWKTITEPTCTKEGMRELVCTTPLCGAKQTEVLAATGHQWDNGTVTQAATEKAEGIKTYTCTVCGATKTEAIAKLSGTENTDNSNASASNSVTTPKTGDTANIWTWALLMTASAGAVTVFLMKKRKSR